MSDIAENTLTRARAALGKIRLGSGQHARWTPECLGRLDEDELLHLTTESLEDAIEDAEIATRVLETQSREIDALRESIRAYSAGVAELRITNASLVARANTITVEMLS